MEYNYYFDIAAVMIFILIMFTTIFRKMYKLTSGRYFIWLVTTCFLATVFDIFSVYQDMGRMVMKVSEYCYLFLRTISATAFCFYLISITNTRHVISRRKWMMLLIIIPFAINMMLLILNEKFGCVFKMVKDGDYYNYEAGSFRSVYYVLAFLNLAYGLIYILYFRRLFNLEKFICAVVLFPMIISAFIIELVKPSMLLEMFATSISCVFLIITIERSELIIDQTSQFKRYSAFVEDATIAELTRRKVEIIVCHQYTYSSLTTLVDFDALEKIKKMTSQRIRDISKEYAKNLEYYAYGTGTFLIITENFEKNDLYEMSSKIRRSLNDKYDYKTNEITIPTNVMIIKCPGDINNHQDALNMIEVFRRKDTLLNDVLVLSKSKEKDEYMMMNDMDKILERGFANNGYEVYYQPIYNVATGKFDSAEALIRLHDEKYGFMSPGVFIPYAEKNGAIIKIGDFVFDDACSFIAKNGSECGIKYIEVNLSPKQCYDERLTKRFMDILAKYDLDTSAINLEITETDSQASKMMEKNIERLTKCGFTFSLDDYGTGYSNIKRVAEMPLSIVKIDKSFVESMFVPKMRKILKRTIQMIQSMDFEIVVEGVEEAEQLEVFKEYGVGHIQGFYFSKPLPKDEFIKFLKEHNNISEMAE